MQLRPDESPPSVPLPPSSSLDADVRQAVARIRQLTRPTDASKIVGMMAGACAGATTGAITGPVGLAIGIVVGGAIGASSGVVMEMVEHEHRVHDEQLDRDIGVSGGDIGSPNLSHPPARFGMYHYESLGMGSVAQHAPAEGPMQEVD